MDEKDAAFAHDLTTTSALQAQSLVTDLGQWLYRGFCLPGDHALSMLLDYAPPAVRSVGFPVDTGGALTASVAGVIWLGSIILTVMTYRVVRDVYITVTGYAALIYQSWLRIGRNAARRSSIAYKAPGRRRMARAIEPTISEEVQLGELECAVLRCHGGLPLGRVLTAAYIADALDVRVSQTRKALDILVMLQLIDIASGAGRGDHTYRLTPHGERFLAACSAVAAAPGHSVR